MNFKLALDYLKYLIKSTNLHGIHSPFVYDFVKNVVYGKNYKNKFTQIEHLRSQLQKNRSKVGGWDFGKNKLEFRKISEIVKISAKSAKFCRLLYRIVEFKNPETSIELGTSLGLSSAYILKAVNGERQFLTFEGNEEIAKIAKRNFEILKLENPKIIIGNFEETLPLEIEKINKLDFVFFDGNHYCEPTLRYFEICLSKANENAVFVFDDINWSDEMKKSWIMLQNHKSVSLTIDLFFMGIVFINKRLTKEHFIIRF